MEETTINLRPLFLTPLRWWRLILVPTLILFLLGMVYQAIPMLRKEIYTAKARVAIVKARTEVDFETPVETLSEEELLYSMELQKEVLEEAANARRLALVELVYNDTIAQKVLDTFQDELTEEERQPGAVADMVEGSLVSGGEAPSDLIEISITNKDPVKAARIANVWAAEYERLVNRIYAGPPTASDSIRADLGRAKQELSDAQEALNQFLVESRTGESQRLIDEKVKILTILQESRANAVSTIINQAIETNAEIYVAYLAAQSSNRLLAFEKEQERKRAMMNAYLSTRLDAQVNAFTLQREERQRIFNQAYAEKARIDGLLQRARLLHEQAVQGGDSRTTALALTFLKMEVAGVLDEVAGSSASSEDGERGSLLNIQLYSLDWLAPADLVTDAQSIVTTLESRLTELDSIIEQQRQVLLNDEDLALAEPADDTELTRTIREKYPELFERGELGQLSEAVIEDNPLAQAALARANDLLQLRDKRDLLSFSTADTPLNRAINDLEQEIRNLEAQVERDTARQTDLEQARDLAQQTYTTLARKAAEINVADKLPGTEVRFAARASVPVNPVITTAERYGLIIFIFLGFLIGLVGTYGMEFLGPHQPPQRIIGKPEAWWNRLFRWTFTRAELPPPRDPD
jgi:hypothetical protein